MWNHPNRNFGLDVLRAIAITLVVVSHCTFLYPKFNSQLTDAIRLLGATGVDLFFVLSGYLIGGLIIKNLESGKVYLKDLIQFWKRRWLRTLPNYFVVLFLNALLLIFLGDTIIREVVWLYIPFLQNFSTPHPNFFTEAWSLSIEEYAYLLLPAAIYMGVYMAKNIKPVKIFFYTTLTIIIILYVFKYNYYNSEDFLSFKDWSSTFRKVVIYRLDAIYYGFIAVYLMRKYSISNKFRIIFLFCGIAIFIVIHLLILYLNMLPNGYKLFYSLFYLPLISISIAFVFPWFLELKTSYLITDIVRYLSARSYSIYLVNYSLVLLTIEKIIQPSGYAVILYLVSTLIMSEILYNTVELPVLKFRDKTVPR